MNKIQKSRSAKFVRICGLLLTFGGCAHGIPVSSGTPGSEAAATSTAEKPVLLTILLKHDETRSLAEIQENLMSHRFYERFPPAGTTVVDWHVIMGLGQLVVLEAPPSKIAEVKATLAEVSAGAFATDVYPTQNEYPRIRERLLNQGKKSLDAAPVAAGDLLLTIFLRPIDGHDSEATVKLAAERGLYDQFPPKGTTVVNWYEAKGLGAVVLLEFPATMLREVNLSLERHAWKTYRTEFYPTYDFYPPARDTFGLKNRVKKSL